MRQARVFLAMMSLVEQVHQVDTFVHPHRFAAMLDERYAITEAREQKILKTYFTSEGRLKSFPAKEKKKLVVFPREEGGSLSPNSIARERP